MRLLVTGAGGMLGQDLVHAARAAGHDPVALSRADLDVTDPAAVAAAVAHGSPDAIVNCAAWTDVDGAEAERAAASAVNGAGAGHVAAAAADAGAPLVHVSTDYVFDGRAREPYRESAPTGPLSAYGATKLEGEQAVERAGGEHTIARSSWLFGAGGPNFVETMLRLGAHGEVLVVHDQVGSPTYTWHLAYGIVRLIEGIEFGIHHMAAAGKCSWYEFAREIFEQAKVECKVLSSTTEMLGRPAPRPAFSALTTQHEHAIRLPSWHDGLAGYLAQREAETN
jgi:dTDP-4-dehydrorhamnose reductase